jgi:hypothetical protein
MKIYTTPMFSSGWAFFRMRGRETGQTSKLNLDITGSIY